MFKTKTPLLGLMLSSIMMLTLTTNAQAAATITCDDILSVKARLDSLLERLPKVKNDLFDISKANLDLIHSELYESYDDEKKAEMDDFQAKTVETRKETQQHINTYLRIKPKIDSLMSRMHCE